MKLKKPWVWREDCAMYNHPTEVPYQPYPFYWYRVTGLEVELVKQISKTCGVVQAYNEWIPSEAPVPKAPVQDSIKSVDEMYLDRRSWLTLGEVINDPIEQLAEFTWGDTTTKLEYTPDGQLFSMRQYIGGKIIYLAEYSYHKKKDRYFAYHYQNSNGAICQKVGTNWDYIKGKPLITKQYGKRK